MRVLSSAIVAGAEDSPSQPVRTDPDPDVIAVPPPTTAPAEESSPVAIPAPQGPRFVWMLGGVALALVVVLAAAMPRAAKRSYEPARAATAAEPADGGSASTKPPTGGKATPGKTKTKAEARTQANSEPDHEIDMSGDPGSSTKTDTRSDKTDKSDAKPDLRSGSPRTDAKQRAEAELAYRDGEQRAAMGDTAGAKASLLHAAELNPSYAPTYRALGDVYAKTGDTGKARSSYQRYLKLAPNASDAGSVRDRLKAL
jgi:tetratricopeptide (TPR) repeat protein